MNEEQIDLLLHRIREAKELWMMSESDSDEMYSILNDIDITISAYAVESGFVGKMSKSDNPFNKVVKKSESADIPPEESNV